MGSEEPHAMIEQFKGQPKYKMFFLVSAVVKCMNLSPSGGRINTLIICHDLLELWLMPQVSVGKRNLLQKDSVPSYI
jgi:hypothetical protein